MSNTQLCKFGLRIAVRIRIRIKYR